MRENTGAVDVDPDVGPGKSTTANNAGPTARRTTPVPAAGSHRARWLNRRTAHRIFDFDLRQDVASRR
jgi:hypothetical protein